MKKIKLTLLVLFLLTSPLLIQNSLGDTPPDPGGDPSGTGTPVGGAPVGGGLIVMLAMGAAYGLKKVVNFNRSLPEE